MTTEWDKQTFTECVHPIRVDRGKQVKAREYLSSGKYPVVDQGQGLVAGWTDSEAAVIRDGLPYVVFGDHTRLLKYVDFPFALGADGTKLIKPKDDINPLYFYFHLLRLDIPSRGYSRHYGLLKEKAISLPPFPEQKKIAAVLLKIQKAIGMQEKIIQSLRDLKKSIMQHLFTHGLRGEKTKMTEIGEIPESWNVLPMGQFLQIIMGHSPKGYDYNKDRRGLPLLNGPAEFTNKYPLPVQWTTSPTRIAKQGDILFCVRGNTVARMNIADQDYCIGRGLAAIRGLENISTTGYLYFVIQHHAERIYAFATAGGSTFPNFSKADFDSLSVQKPNVNEQKDIAAALSSIDRKMEFHESKKSALQDLFKITLNKLITGDIRVGDLDIDVKEVEG